MPGVVEAIGGTTSSREPPSERRSVGRGLVGRAANRWVPITLVALSVVTGMAYSLWWGQVVQHHTRHPYWITPGDFWATVRAAHFVGWHDLGGVYSATGVVVTFPGILVLLAPLVMLGARLGLSESYPFLLPHPSSWLLYGPVEIALAGFALLGLDALAERLGASRRRRGLVVVVAAVVLWQVPVIWGHPEDAIALGCAAYGLVAALDERWVATAWWFGAGLAFQPLVGLAYPVVLGVAGWRRWAPMLARTLLVPGFLVAVPLVANFAQASRSLITQPTYPQNPNAHDTPLLALARRLKTTHSATTASARTTTARATTARATTAITRAGGATGAHRTRYYTPGPLFSRLHAGAAHLPAAVSGSTPRIGAVLVALVMMWFAARHRHDPHLVAWAAAVALAARPVFEAVDFPYYLAPGVAALVVVAATPRRTASAALVALALGTTVLGYYHLGQWPWWLAMTTGTLLIAGIAAPGAATRPSSGRAPAGAGAAGQPEPRLLAEPSAS